jgi:hypothetical protein
MVQTDRPQMIIWRMRITCWITKGTDTHAHSEYVTLIALQGINGYANTPHCYVYKHIACLVSKVNDKLFSFALANSLMSAWSK